MKVGIQMKKYKMAKWKKTLYLGGLLIGVLLSIISFLFAYRVDNDPLLNYLIGLLGFPLL